jgi:hypothetical protein
MEYTVEVYKLDKRYKDGQRLSFKQDYEGVPLDVLEKMHPRGKGRIVMIHETYVTKKNLMGGGLFRERYDTPYFCSPASEAYWSM